MCITQKVGSVYTYSILFLLMVFVHANAQQWEILNEGIEGEICDIEFVSKDVGWLNGYKKFLKTEDGGETWQSFPKSDYYGIGIVDFIDESVAWTKSNIDAEDGSGYCVILKSIDGGQSWIEKYQTQDNDWIRSLFPVNESIVYAAGYSEAGFGDNH